MPPAPLQLVPRIAGSGNGCRDVGLQDSSHGLRRCVAVISPVQTSGTFVNALKVALKSFHGVVKPLGDTVQPGRCLACIDKPPERGRFRFETSEEVRNRALGDIAVRWADV